MGTHERARPPALFHVVLHEPQIPNNTGNIGRTCVATGCALHLIHPLAFDTSEKACRRAGLDYWPRLNVLEHASWSAYERAAAPAASDKAANGGALPRRWAFSTKGGRSVFGAAFEPGDHLVFGNEAAGLPEEILALHAGRVLRLPMAPGERSLNLATAVCAAVYEGVRQLLARGVIREDALGNIAPISPGA